MINWFRIETSDATNRKAVVPVVGVGRIGVIIIEVQVVSKISRRTSRRGPIVPVEASVVEKRAVDVPATPNRNSKLRSPFTLENDRNRLQYRNLS